MNFGLRWIMQLQCKSKLYRRGERLAMALFFFFRRSGCWKVLFHWLLNRTENMDFCALSDLSAYPFACSLIWFLFFSFVLSQKDLFFPSLKNSEEQTACKCHHSFCKGIRKFSARFIQFLLGRREIISDFSCPHSWESSIKKTQMNLLRGYLCGHTFWCVVNAFSANKSKMEWKGQTNILSLNWYRAV